MLSAVFLYNGCTGIGLIAKDLSSGLAAQLVDNFLGKTIGVGGHGVGRDDPRDLPMSGGGVLATGKLGQLAVAALGLLHGAAAAYFVDVEHPHPGHIGNGKLLRAAQGAQGVAAKVAVVGGVGQFPHPHAVQNNQKNSFDGLVHFGSSLQNKVSFRQ